MPKDLFLKLEAFLWLWTYQLGLRLLSFGRLSTWPARLARPGRSSADPDALIRRVRTAVRRANGRVWKARCLADALAAQTMLARRGVAAELRIGVKKEAAKLDAHAWLEREGRCILGEGELEAFTKLRGLD